MTPFGGYLGRCCVGPPLKLLWIFTPRHNQNTKLVSGRTTWVNCIAFMYFFALGPNIDSAKKSSSAQLLPLNRR